MSEDVDTISKKEKPKPRGSKIRMPEDVPCETPLLTMESFNNAN
jgi:hypothetical protein